jgi:hypothetical protein
MDKKEIKRKALSQFAVAFVELFEHSDMRPEDACHDLYVQAQEALAMEDE